MNRRWHWNSHQRHKFLRAKASRDILKFRVLEMPFPGVFKRYFPLQTPCCFIRIHARLGKAIEMSQVFHDIAKFEHFTAFNVIQNWETDALQFYLMALIFYYQLWQKEMKVAGGLAGYQPLLTAPHCFYTHFNYN